MPMAARRQTLRMGRAEAPVNYWSNRRRRSRAIPDRSDRKKTTLLKGTMTGTGYTSFTTFFSFYLPTSTFPPCHYSCTAHVAGPTIAVHVGLKIEAGYPGHRGTSHKTTAAAGIESAGKLRKDPRCLKADASLPKTNVLVVETLLAFVLAGPHIAHQQTKSQPGCGRLAS